MVTVVVEGCCLNSTGDEVVDEEVVRTRPAEALKAEVSIESLMSDPEELLLLKLPVL